MLVSKIAEVEMVVKQLRGEKKRMQKKHRDELRCRDRKELLLFVLLGTCLVIYACIALTTKGVL